MKYPRLSRFTLALLILLGLPGVVRSDLFTPADFTLFAVHPDAVNQPSTRGKTISDIESYAGQLYTAYGDWTLDTGPIQIRTLDPNSATWSNSLLTFGTEAISHFRSLRGQLYAPNLDPLGTPGVNPGGFAVGGSSHSWNQVDNVAATHVFDLNVAVGSDLWMVGSMGSNAMIWRSTDGGANFTVARQDGPPSGSQASAFSRYTGAASLNNKLYVQRVDANTSQRNTESLVFDGAAWATGPNLVSQTNGFMFQPQEFADQLVYMVTHLSNNFLYRFDENSSQLALPVNVYDYHILDEKILVLAEGGELLVSTDLTNWLSAGFAPKNARSLGFSGNRLFVGTNNAALLSAGLTSVPEPSHSLALFAFALLFGFRQRKRQRVPYRSACRLGMASRCGARSPGLSVTSQL